MRAVWDWLSILLASNLSFKAFLKKSKIIQVVFLRLFYDESWLYNKKGRYFIYLHGINQSDLKIVISLRSWQILQLGGWLQGPDFGRNGSHTLSLNYYTQKVYFRGWQEISTLPQQVLHAWNLARRLETTLRLGRINMRLEVIWISSFVQANLKFEKN